jgi:hypothetical protein
MPFIIEADAAGRAICAGLERERAEIVFPVRMAILMKAARLVPVRLWSALWSRISPPERLENMSHANTTAPSP